MADTVKVTKNGKTATVVRKSFENVWKHKGWTEAKQDDAPSAGGVNVQAIKSDDKADDKAPKQT